MKEDQNSFWSATEVRRVFLNFFESKSHEIVASAPMVVKNDPTLMFTNAGMNQFKDIFLGNRKPQSQRVANSQKCLRVSGKHNDLEEVGVDTYHHTMFEMLGNWSFGDYFKADAIAFAWELLTVIYKISPEDIYVTVFGGDEEDGLDIDTDATEEWKKWIDPTRILRFGKKDNFWEMGESGPCGPCSEIHIDIRSDDEKLKQDARELVNAGHPQVIEIWNLVFIQFNRASNGKLDGLPAKHVDTGMGFERLCMVLQGKKSNYDTDVFQSTIRKVATEAGINYGSKETTDVALRVIADHIRAICFSIADGQLPSNNKAGYVIRRILRRALRYGYTFLNFKEAFMYKLVHIIAEQFAEVFPNIKEQEDLITKVIREEEAAFLKTLETGISRFNTQQDKVISGEFAFELYDTYGFPIDLTQLMAKEQGKEVDMAGFNNCLQKQKERSRHAAKVETDDWIVIREDDKSEFVGYDRLESELQITRYRKVKQKNKEFYQLVFNQTPFYAESGGQVGDTGFLSTDAEKVRVFDTKKENELTVHFCDKLPQNLNGYLKATVDKQRRIDIMRNHSATHLMHAALKQVLGDHVNQKGSLVNENYTRFDFSHFQKLEKEHVEKIESLVNEKIRMNIELHEERNIPMKEAMDRGATALFGEKYGDTVRVISFDPAFSMELCGGTHVQATGEIGFFKIISESSVAAGVRRIEALTGVAAEKYLHEQLQQLDEVKQLMNNPANLKGSIRELIDKQVKYEQKFRDMMFQQAKGVKAELLSRIREVNGLRLISEKVDIPSADVIKQLSFEIKNEEKNLVLLLGAEIEGKAHLSLIISENLVEEHKMDATKIIRELAKEIKGGGGGQKFYATAGGKEPGGLSKAIDKCAEFLGA